MATLYKICPVAMWRNALSEGIFRGSEADMADGFIHFSTGRQVAETAAKHFADRDDLVLVAIDGDAFGAALKWEPARSGDLFPHLYGTFDPRAALWAAALPLGADGRHRFPVLLQ